MRLDSERSSNVTAWTRSAKVADEQAQRYRDIIQSIRDGMTTHDDPEYYVRYYGAKLKYQEQLADYYRGAAEFPDYEQIVGSVAREF